MDTHPPLPSVPSLCVPFSLERYGQTATTSISGRFNCPCWDLTRARYAWQKRHGETQSVYSSCCCFDASKHCSSYRYCRRVCKNLQRDTKQYIYTGQRPFVQYGVCAYWTVMTRMYDGCATVAWRITARVCTTERHMRLLNASVDRSSVTTVLGTSVPHITLSNHSTITPGNCTILHRYVVQFVL